MWLYEMMYMGRMSGIDFHIDSDNWFAKLSNLMENFKSHLLLDGKFVVWTWFLLLAAFFVCVLRFLILYCKCN